MGARTRGFANNVLTSGKIDATDGLTGNLAATNFSDATVTNVEELPPAVGSAISSVAGNPAAPVAEGKIWYNTNTDSFNVAASAEAWSSASPLGTGRYLAAGFGTETAGVYTMGTIPPANKTGITEEYNGTGWSAGTTYPITGNGGGGAGTQTAGLIAGGGSPRGSTANEYDGSSWTATGSLPTAADNLGSCGTNTQTNVIMAVGRTPATGNSGTNNSVTYDGSTFSSGPNLNVTRMWGVGSGSGTGTAGLVFGGFIDPSPNAMTNTEEFDGSSWSNGGNLNTASSFISGFGTQTDTVTQTNGSNYTVCEKYDGSAWSSTASLSVSSPGGLYGMAAGLTGSAGWIAAMGPTSSATEEFSRSLNVITGAAWASGTAIPVAVRGHYGYGPATAGLTAGGIVGTVISQSYEYDGSAWTSGGSIPSNGFIGGGGGTQTAAVFAGWGTGAPPAPTNSAEYDGATWTSSGSLNTNRYYGRGGGTQTATLLVGGNGDPGIRNQMEFYDGTSWTSQPQSLNTARSNSGGAGTQTDAIVWQGYVAPGHTNTTEVWNGSSWTATSNFLLSNEGNATGDGQSMNSSSALSAGTGNPETGNSYSWDGSVWSTAPSLTTPRGTTGLFGGSTDAVVSGGYAGSPANTTAVEEFTGETSALNVESLTTS